MPTVFNDSQEIHFEDTGSGPAVVLGHSFLFSGAMWAPQVPVLAERYRVINVDFRGHGASGPVIRRFSLYDAVADVIAVLDHLGVERAAWCGLSVGGMVALRAALSHPHRVARLALLDTDGGPENPYQRLKFALMSRGARRVGVGPFLPFVTPLMFGRSSRRRGLPEIEAWKAYVRTLHLPSIVHGSRAIARRDSLLSVLGQIDVPALVVVGEEDRALPPERSVRLAEALPHSRLVRVPKAGHITTLEDPDTVNGLLLEFLNEGAW